MLLARLALICLRVLVILTVSVHNAMTCGMNDTVTKQIVLRYNSTFSLQCSSTKMNELNVQWGSDYFVWDCKLQEPTKPALGTSINKLTRTVTFNGGCTASGVAASLTFNPIDLDDNSHAVYCNYGITHCEEYFMSVYDPGFLQLTYSAKTASGGLVTRSASNSSGQNTATQSLALDSAFQTSSTQFNFTCAFAQCGATHESRFAWFINSDSGINPGKLSTSQPDSPDCSFTSMVDGDDGPQQEIAGKYASRSLAAWDGGEFLRQACAKAGGAAARTVSVRVGCVAQYKVYTARDTYEWTNNTQTDGLWQTIVLECPHQVSAMAQVGMIGIAAGLVATLVVIVVVVLLVVRVRASRRAHEPIAQDDAAHQGSTPAVSVSNNGQFDKKPPMNGNGV